MRFFSNATYILNVPSSTHLLTDFKSTCTKSASGTSQKNIGPFVKPKIQSVGRSVHISSDWMSWVSWVEWVEWASWLSEWVDWVMQYLLLLHPILRLCIRRFPIWRPGLPHCRWKNGRRRPLFSVPLQQRSFQRWYGSSDCSRSWGNSCRLCASIPAVRIPYIAIPATMLRPVYLPWQRKRRFPNGSVFERNRSNENSTIYSFIEINKRSLTICRIFAASGEVLE